MPNHSDSDRRENWPVERPAERSVRRGRPPLPPHEARSERVVTFVTTGEFDTLIQIADDRGASVSSVIHRILSSALLKEKQGSAG
jgi:hypothetical protein